MASHKYLDECGFTVFKFGVHKDGHVDVESNIGAVVNKVTQEQLVEIKAYVKQLEVNVKNYIEIHYWKDK